MFEGADRNELQRLGMFDDIPRFTALCNYCGRDPKEKWVGWISKDSPPIFACCDKRLIDHHGANPNQIVRQSLRGLFGADPVRMLRDINTTLARR